uniref:Uncharacterized protein n=1 Tax=Magnetococcus massalia (strain MO-1) TaxID=451514 RepID=A0A1S7LHY2_MAGMO|nr:Protein of unknown function [Candidatus Magnetococcus massalia]
MFYRPLIRTFIATIWQCTLQELFSLAGLCILFFFLFGLYFNIPILILPLPFMLLVFTILAFFEVRPLIREKKRMSQFIAAKNAR